MGAKLWQTISDWDEAIEVVRRRRYGVIEASTAEFKAIHFRPWPKLLAWPEVWPVGSSYHASGQADRCLLYFNQPWQCPNFLALKYVVSTHGSSYATFRTALNILDAVAQIKQTDALLCDAFNSRLSDRFLQRMGWEPHKPQRWHRNFIRRFYGEYPQHGLPLAEGDPKVPSPSVASIGAS